MTRMAWLATLSLSLIAASTAEKTKVIIIADVGVDDAAGLFWALDDYDDYSLEVMGIAASFGSHPDPTVTANNARRVLEAAGRSDVPVFVGSRWPLGTTEPHQVDDVTRRFMGDDGFGGSQECVIDEIASQISAAEFIVTSARAHPGEITLLTFSPLTDVALASLLEPRLPSLLRSIVAMGGALDAPGNVTPLAEANFNHDARAARIVVKSFAETLVLVPLDVTEQAIVTEEDVRHAPEIFTDAFATFRGAYCGLLSACEGAPVHDAHVVAYLTNPNLYETKTVAIDVAVAQPGDDAHGMVVVDRRSWANASLTVNEALDQLFAGKGKATAPKVTVLTNVNASEFRKELAFRFRKNAMRYFTKY
jgi:purine nucleosidase